MKSCATGLIIRPFNVMMPTGLGKAGSLTGSTLIAGLFAPNRRADVSNIPNHGPPASRVLYIWTELQEITALGISRLQARNVSAMTVLVAVPGFGKSQGSLTNSTSSM